MIRSMIQAALLLILCPLLAAQQAAMPDSPEPAATGAGDWNRVRDLANSDKISVARAGGHAVPCRFTGATKDYLFCDSLFSGRAYRFDRAEVEDVRRDDKQRNLHILVGAFAAVGFVWGVAAPPSSSNPTPRGLTGLAGAGLGALAGCAVSIPAAFLIPGRLVYRHSPPGPTARVNSLAPQSQPVPDQPNNLAPATPAAHAPTD